jgi:hypothetical protein
VHFITKTSLHVRNLRYVLHFFFLYTAWLGSDKKFIFIRFSSSQQWHKKIFAARFSFFYIKINTFQGNSHSTEFISKNRPTLLAIRSFVPGYFGPDPEIRMCKCKIFSFEILSIYCKIFSFEILSNIEYYLKWSWRKSAENYVEWFIRMHWLQKDILLMNISEQWRENLLFIVVWYHFACCIGVIMSPIVVIVCYRNLMGLWFSVLSPFQEGSIYCVNTVKKSKLITTLL